MQATLPRTASFLGPFQYGFKIVVTPISSYYIHCPTFHSKVHDHGHPRQIQLLVVILILLIRKDVDLWPQLQGYDVSIPRCNGFKQS